MERSHLSLEELEAFDPGAPKVCSAGFVARCVGKTKPTTALIAA